MKKDVKITKLNLFIRLVTLILLSVLTLPVSGCDRRTKHKVLTFFFTGVPPLEEEKKPGEPTENVLVPKEKNKPPKPVLYSHTPYVKGFCHQCHQIPSEFRLLGQNKAIGSFKKGGGMPGKLLFPKKELCINCHDYLSASKAFADRTWLHTTAAKGECDKCHDSHQSKNKYMLLKKPEIICKDCHLGGTSIKPAKQCNPDECLGCHNPHLGKDRLMLIKDYNEEKQPVKPIA